MKALSWLMAFATIFGVSVSNLVQFWESSGFWTRFFLVLVLIAAGALGIIDALTWFRNRPKHFKNESSVNKYMLHLLRRGGSARIFAHNLSWVRNSPEICQFLKHEAGQGRDICIFVPQHNALTQELEGAGVRIRTYASLDYVPEARFTLLNPNEPGSSLLAIGKGTFPDFNVEEFSDLTHSRVISVARDLINTLERVDGLVHA